jgi:hypothetical protein
MHQHSKVGEKIEDETVDFFEHFAKKSVPDGNQKQYQCDVMCL